jgi:hypothetical protein
MGRRVFLAEKEPDPLEKGRNLACEGRDPQEKGANLAAKRPEVGVDGFNPMGLRFFLMGPGFLTGRARRSELAAAFSTRMTSS